jgi:hypothetical protein
MYRIVGRLPWAVAARDGGTGEAPAPDAAMARPRGLRKVRIGLASRRIERLQSFRSFACTVETQEA